MDKREPIAEFSWDNEIFEISGFQNTKTKQNKKQILKHCKIKICKYLNVSKYSIIWTIQLQLNRNQIFTQIIISMGCGYILTCLMWCGVGLLKESLGPGKVFGKKKTKNGLRKQYMKINVRNIYLPSIFKSVSISMINPCSIKLHFYIKNEYIIIISKI